MNKTYSIRAPNTKRMQANIQASMAVRPSALGVLVVTLLKMLTSTRNKVTRRAILPGITSIGMRNDIQDTITNRPCIKYHLRKKNRKVSINFFKLPNGQQGVGGREGIKY